MPSASEQRIRELEGKVRELQHLLKSQLQTDDLRVESGVSAATGKGFLTLRWGDQIGQLTPDEARAHGLAMIDVAAAAEMDAAIVRALTSGLDHPMSLPEAGAFLMMLREHRDGGVERSMEVRGPEPARPSNPEETTDA